MRVVVGLLWLANLEWKRPPDFGRAQKNGLYKYVESAITNPVFQPYTEFIERVVVPNYKFFGWLTLITEAVVAALLIIGWKTRWVALIGSFMTINAFLSVLYYTKDYEWPWSYYLMFAAHLLLFATAAGQHFGLDGLRGKSRAAWDRGALLIGMVGVGVGALGLFVGRNVDFAASRGAILGWEKGELKLLWVTPLGALLTLALGALAVVGALLHRRVLGIAAAAGFALMTVQVLVQWRGTDGGVLGGTGANLAFWGMLAAGIARCSLPVSVRRRPITSSSEPSKDPSRGGDRDDLDSDDAAAAMVSNDAATGAAAVASANAAAVS